MTLGSLLIFSGVEIQAASRWGEEDLRVKAKSKALPRGSVASKQWVWGGSVKWGSYKKPIRQTSSLSRKDVSNLSIFHVSFFDICGDSSL